MTTNTILTNYQLSNLSELLSYYCLTPEEYNTNYIRDYSDNDMEKFVNYVNRTMTEQESIMKYICDYHNACTSNLHNKKLTCIHMVLRKISDLTISEFFRLDNSQKHSITFKFIEKDFYYGYPQTGSIFTLTDVSAVKMKVLIALISLCVEVVYPTIKFESDNDGVVCFSVQ